MPDVFLSYSREDQVTARRFAEALKREGFSVWWDQALHPGETFDKVTESVLKEAKAVVVLWSKNSVDSRWVRSEASQADRFGTLVPVMIEHCDRPILFELSHTADLSGWSGDTDDVRWRSFLDNVKHQVAKSGPGVSQASTAPSPVTARTVSRRWLGWAGAAAAVLVAVCAAWYLHGRPASVPVAKGGASIAVMPFDDMSATKDQEYFADGVAEEILNTLARIPDLKVTARNSSFAFRGRKEDLRKVGQELGVANLLEGSIRKDGNTLRITAQLIKADDGFHLWSKTYDRPLTDIFAVQEDIARSVAEALQITLGVGLGQAPGMTRNVDAYDAFLAANAVPSLFTQATTRKRIGLLQQAVAADPNFAWAWAVLAYAFQVQAAAGGADAQQARQQAEAAYQQHVRLLPGSPLIPTQAAGASIRQGNWIEAEKHGREAREAAAKLFSTVNTQGSPLDNANFLIMVGRIRDALPLLEEAKSHDPLNQYSSFALAWAYGAIGDYPASFAEFERGDRLAGPEQFRIRTSGTQVALGAKDRQQLQRWLDGMIELEVQMARGAAQGERPNFHGQMKALLDKPKEALTLLLSVDRRTMPQPLALSGRAQWIAYFGDEQDALENLRVAFDRGVVEVTSYSMWGPALHEVRKLPGFRQLMIDHGFVAYWRASGWGDFCKPTTGDDFECN